MFKQKFDNQMNVGRFRLKLLLTSALIVGPATQASAQQALFEQEDSNGIDVVAGTTRIAGPSISVGDKSTTKLTADVTFSSFGLNLELFPRLLSSIAVYPTPNTASVVWRGQVDEFLDTGPLGTPVFVSRKQDGPTLTCATYAGPCTYKSEDGIEIDFVENPQNGTAKKPTVIRYPDGEKITFKNYTSTQTIANTTVAGPRNSFIAMESNRGFGVGITIVPSLPGGDTDIAGNYYWDSIFTYNRAVDNCSTTNCSFAQTPPALTRIGDRKITDSNGGLWQWTNPYGYSEFGYIGEFGLSSVRTPTNTSADAMSFATNASGQQLVTRGGYTWTYTFSNNTSASPVTGTTTVLDPMGGTTVYNHSGGRVNSVIDPLNRITTYGYDASYRLTSVTAPEGNITQYTYDARGNVTSATLFPKPSSGLPAITTLASYPAACANTASCNKPIYTRDASGNQTDYTYDATTGLTTSITAPAATTGGVRPQTRFGYTALQAYIKDGGTGIVATGLPIQKLTTISTCQTTASCAGVLDESKTTIGYGPQTAGTANNLLPVTQTVASGTGSVTTTTTSTYDAVGNVTAVNGPLAGTADTTSVRYDAGRRVVGVIAPDPDGAGARKRNAQRTTYNGDGQVTLEEAGTVDGTTNANWTAFASAEQVATEYDIRGNAVKESKTAGGTTYAVTQTSYDALGREDCSVQRMDPSQWASQTAACTPQTAGPNGPDRVSKTHYDAASQVIKVQTAVGTGEVSDEVTSTYSPNGKVASVKDAENNLTSYAYDGHDRLNKTSYPVATLGAAASSTTDYEQLSYDTNSNVTQRRLRDGQLINLGFDKLDRVVSKDLPGTEPDATYTYDLLNRQKTAVQNGQTITFSYDALSRNTNQAGPNGTVSFFYDLASRRTRVTYPGTTALYVGYVRDVTGQVTHMRENGATATAGNAIATYAYDSLGRQTSTTYGNGATRSFGYDPISRLSSLTNNPAATVNDQTINFSYNPASQIVSQTKSSDVYAWTGHYNITRPYGANGLNQLTSAGATALGYDARGNLTSSGANAYTYSSENFLKTGPSSAALSYDPLGRLYQTVGAGVTSRFLYDGDAMIAEYNGTNVLQRRYVHGPGTDEPILWYEGSVLTNKRYLMADERGSIVNVSDGSGATLALNKYDEFGIPQTGNLGRFGYTGQTWLPEIGMNYYKARIYSPTLGRFMHTDPIGYGDGMNWYNYVGSDPINKTDPTGNEGCNQTPGQCGPIVVNGVPSSLFGGSFISGSFGVSPNPSGFGTGLSLSNLDGEQPIVVTASKRAPARRATGNFNSQRGGGNMSSSEYGNLNNEQLLDKLKKSKGKERVKLQREAKARGLRNTNKVRGGLLRGFIGTILLIPDTILFSFECLIPQAQIPARCLIA